MNAQKLRQEAAEVKRRADELQRAALNQKEKQREMEKQAKAKKDLKEKEKMLEMQARLIQQQNDKKVLNQKQEWPDEIIKDKKGWCTVRKLFNRNIDDL